MRWSKLKQRLEQNFAESVAGRIELHQTRYRKSHDQTGEFSITLDGKQILSAGSMTALNALYKTMLEYRNTGLPTGESYERADEALEKDGTVEAGRVVALLKNYLNQSIDEVVRAENPIIRALGLLDRRFGIRRLERFDPSKEHELVARVFQIRCDLEGIFKQPIRATPRSEHA